VVLQVLVKGDQKMKKPKDHNTRSHVDKGGHIHDRSLNKAL